MKQIIILIALSLMGYAAQAQVISLYGGNGLAIDTLANSTTEYITTAADALNSIGTSGNYDIQLTCTNISGTTTITASLESSIDGSTWTPHFGIAGTTGINCDNKAISGTTTHVWTIKSGAVYSPTDSTAFHTNAGRRLYFRVKLVGGATQSTQYKAKLITQL